MAQTLSKRELMRARQRRKHRAGRFIWVSLGLTSLAIIVAILWRGVRPRAGEEMSVMANKNHLPLDSDPGQYSTNPPTSGPHYAEELDAKFYETNNYPFPAGYLVHNLEHGYVVFWYNCGILDETSCGALKSQIESVIDEVNNFKVIAYPWDSIDVPVAMTSWGRLLKMETFDAEKALAFYRTNLNHAPESNAP